MSAAASRAGFIGGGARRVAALALAAGSLGAAGGCGGEEPRARILPTPAAALDDRAIARILTNAELLAVDFYRRALGVAGFSGTQTEYLRSALANEQVHLRTMQSAAGTPGSLRFDYPSGTFESPGSVLRTGVVLEEAFLGAYLGAVSELRDARLRSIAARIAANEAQHLQGLSSLDASGPGSSPSLPAVLTPQEAASIVAPFLA